MPNISHRAEAMPSSPVRKLMPYANAAKARGIKVYHLNIGQPDIPTPKTALEAIRNIDLQVLEYAPSDGIPAYKTALKNYYHRLGLTDLTEANFIATNGGSEALSFALSTLCDDGDEVLVIEPYYANYNGFAKSFNIKMVAVQSYLEDNFALPAPENLEEKITPKTRAILICNPGNPTGYLYKREELQQLADLALKHNLTVVSDEVYREYVYGEDRQVSMLEFPELKDHCIAVDSESKRYSMCGARVGFFVTRNEQFYTAAMKFAQARLSPVLLGQIAAAAAHQNDEEYIRTVREEYHQRRDLLVSRLQQIPGVKCPVPTGAFYCAVELPVKDTEDFARWLLEEFQHGNETVMLAPMGGFYSDPELGRHQVRVAYVLEKKDLERSAELLTIALQRYQERENQR